MESALDAIEAIDEPGVIVDPGLRWEDGAQWKETAMQPNHGKETITSDDDRLPRSEKPIYQEQDDLVNIEKHCRTCVFFDES